MSTKWVVRSSTWLVSATLVVLLAAACDTMNKGEPDSDVEVDRDTSSEDAIRTDAEDGTGDDLVPDSCNEFGVEFEACATCPTEPMTCDCLPPWSHPLADCQFGRCTAALDCGRICENSPDEGSEDPYPVEFLDDLTALTECLSTYRCRVDADCGDGLCVTEIPGEIGWCGTGDNATFCVDRDDCLSGLCVAYAHSGGGCYDGSAGAPCNTDADCRNGATCLSYHAPQQQIAPGVCTRGEFGDACLQDTDCVAGPCVSAYTDGALGACTDASVGQPCLDAEDCDSGFCFDHPAPDGISGVCTTGGFRSHCMTGEHCQSGYCSQQPGGHPDNPNVGTCVSGENGGPCFTDVACASGLCALNGSSSEGICSSGELGAPCLDVSDCRAGSCVGPMSANSADCVGVTAGSACEGNGVCLGYTCHQRKCN